MSQATTRAKFRCVTVEQFSNQPVERTSYPSHGGGPTSYMSWQRTYKFLAVMDSDTPENERYAQATPSGQLTIQVDNPAVIFEPGKEYYLDFTPADGQA